MYILIIWNFLTETLRRLPRPKEPTSSPCSRLFRPSEIGSSRTRPRIVVLENDRTSVWVITRQAVYIIPPRVVDGFNIHNGHISYQKKLFWLTNFSCSSDVFHFPLYSFGNNKRRKLRIVVDVDIPVNEPGESDIDIQEKVVKFTDIGWKER